MYQLATCECCLLVKLMWKLVLDVDMKMVTLYSVDSHKAKKTTTSTCNNPFLSQDLLEWRKCQGRAGLYGVLAIVIGMFCN